MFELQKKQISRTIDPCDISTNRLYFHNYHSAFKIVTKSRVLIGIFGLHHFACPTDSTDWVLKEAVSGLLQAFWGSTMPTKRQTPHSFYTGLDLIYIAFR